MRVPKKCDSATNVESSGYQTVSSGTFESITPRDDLILRISSLLQENVGSTRVATIHLTGFALDDDLNAREVDASVKVTRLNTSVLVAGSATGTVEMECVRCLNRYDQPFKSEFAEQFRQSGEALGGHGYTPPTDDYEDEDGDEELAFEINDAHEIDLTEMLRQHILLALPMTPNCGASCPGPEQITNNLDEPIDARFAALQQLLETGDE